MPKTKQIEPVYNRGVPFNTEAENYVLGSILIDNNIIDRILGKVVAEDFYEPRNSSIYNAMCSLRQNNEIISILTVVEELKKLNYQSPDQIGSYLTDVIDSVPSTASVDMYIEVVEEKGLERKLINRLNALIEMIYDNQYDLNEILDKTEDTVMEVVKERRNSEFMDMGEAAEKTYNRISSFVGRDENSLTGLNTGYKLLNESTLGFQKGDLMILAARPAVGKSTYAMNLALNVAKYNDAHVAFFSLEMSIEQLMMRIYSNQTLIDLSKIRSGNLTDGELLTLGRAREELKKVHMYFDTNVSSNIADIRNKCRQLKQQNQLDFVVIDYLQLITATIKGRSRNDEVAQISRQLKTLAQELEVPILALSQLSRDVDKSTRQDKTPQLSDLRESGSIEQDADMVFFIYLRSDVEDQDVAEELNEKVKEMTQQQELTKNDNDEKQSKVKEVIVSLAKNRQGPLRDFDYNFYGNYCRFSESPIFRKITKKKNNRGTRRITSADIK